MDVEVGVAVGVAVGVGVDVAVSIGAQHYLQTCATKAIQGRNRDGIYDELEMADAHRRGEKSEWKRA